MKKNLAFVSGMLVASLVFVCSVSALTDEKMAAGLKEALNVGIENAVKLVGVEDGYFKNDAIKILLPEELKKADKYLQDVGGGAVSEALVEKMNRAAEKAAPEALDIFVSSVKEMKIDDAMKIFSGEKNAATAYLEEHASEPLRKSFYPIVKNTMEEVGALKSYNEYIGKLKSGKIGQVGSLLKSTGLAESGPLKEITDIELDINQYVTEKAIGGLFKMLAEEEVKIRENPEARVTDLLEDVFGGLLK